MVIGDAMNFEMKQQWRQSRCEFWDELFLRDVPNSSRGDRVATTAPATPLPPAFDVFVSGEEGKCESRAKEVEAFTRASVVCSPHRPRRW